MISGKYQLLASPWPTLFCVQRCSPDRNHHQIRRWLAHMWLQKCFRSLYFCGRKNVTGHGRQYLRSVDMPSFQQRQGSIPDSAPLEMAIAGSVDLTNAFKASPHTPCKLKAATRQRHVKSQYHLRPALYQGRSHTETPSIRTWPILHQLLLEERVLTCVSLHNTTTYLANIDILR